MGLVLDNIHGYRETIAVAQAEEEALRDFPFLDVSTDIDGIPVRQFTPRHLVILFAARSPFLCGGGREAEDIAQFLWVISPEFRSGDVRGRRRFVRRYHKAISGRPEIIRAGINRYLDSALMDAPCGGGPQRIPTTSFIAALVHRIAAEYGWDDEVIMDKPIARLYQYLRRITLDRDSNAALINRHTDRARREFVEAFLKSQRQTADKEAQL